MGFFERLLGGHHRGGGHHGRKGYYDSGYGHGGGYTPQTREQGVACPACQTFNAPQARFCQSCGKSMVPSACGQCGTTVPPGAKFCSQCGKPA